MRPPFSYIPAVPVAIGMAAGIVGFVAGLPWWGATCAMAAAVVLFALRWRYASVVVAAMVAGWFLAWVHMPAQIPDDVQDRDTDYTATVVRTDDYDGALRMVVATHRGFRGLLLVRQPEWQPVQGDIVAFKAAFHPLRKSDIPYEIDYNYFHLVDGVTAEASVAGSDLKVTETAGGWRSVLLRWRAAVEDAIVSSKLSPGASAMMLAIVAGDDLWLSPGVKADFRATGLAHMLAISGFHVGIVVMLVMIALYPLRLFSRVGRLRYAFVVLAVWIFTLLVGAPVSAIRASVMVSVYMLARLLQRGVSPYNSLAVAALAILAVNPFALYSPGFQLSFSAVCGILAFAEPLNQVSARRHRLHSAVGAVTVCVGAIAGTAVFTMLYFHMLPVGFLLLNVVMAWLFVPMTVSALIALVLPFTAFVPNGIYCVVEWLGSVGSAARWARVDALFPSVTSAVALAVGIVAVAFVVNLRRRRATIYGMAVVSVAVLVAVAAWPVPPTAEAFVTDRGLIVRSADSAVLVSDRPTGREMLARRFGDYLASRGLGDTLSVTDGDFELHGALRRGSDVAVGGTVMAVLDSRPVRVDAALHHRYVVVTPTFTRDAAPVLDALRPDTVVIALGGRAKHRAAVVAAADSLDIPVVIVEASRRLAL